MRHGFVGARRRTLNAGVSAVCAAAGRLYRAAWRLVMDQKATSRAFGWATGFW